MKKTLEEQKERFHQIVELGRELGPLASNPFKSSSSTAKFGMLPPELRNKDVYTKEELALILNALKKKVDEIGNYRIYDLERFLGIFVDD